MNQAWKDELPVAELPDDPRWRENFCFDGYDKDRDIGFWIHCGRWSLDPRIWREQVLVYLPGGDYLVHRAWGFPILTDHCFLAVFCRNPRALKL